MAEDRIERGVGWMPDAQARSGMPQSLNRPAAKELLRNLLADGEVHALASLYEAVQARGLTKDDQLRVPAGPGYDRLRTLGLEPDNMSAEEKDAAVREHD